MHIGIGTNEGGHEGESDLGTHKAQKNELWRARFFDRARICAPAGELNTPSLRQFSDPRNIQK